MDYVNFNFKDWDIKLRGDNGKYFTQALFFEFGNKDAIYTLRPDNHINNGKEYVSVYQVFMASVDEHDAAIKLLGSKSHWKKLCECDWFLDGYTFGNESRTQLEGLKEWRKDMKARDESLAKKVLLEQANEGNVSAAKAILDGSKEKNNVGRTRKDKPEVKKTSSSATILKLAENR